ncbi:MAG: MATE family efflux transporter [Eubacterium sp.]|nr:MATE family efflux transporter [Eubacterium sp.]
MNPNYMKEKPVLPLFVSAAIPMVLSMLVNSLYNIIDSIFVAKISEEAMTALSLVFPVQNLVTSIGVGFGVGVNAVIAMSLGAGKQKDADVAASQGILFSIVHGVLLTVFGILAMPSFLGIFTESETVFHFGVRYAVIVLSFSVIVTVEITFEKIFQSIGRMLVSTFCLLTGCVVNIVLDPLLIFGIGPFPEMGIEGAAWATNIGQLSTLVIYLTVWAVKRPNLKLSLKLMKPTRQIAGSLYLTGIPATLNMALPSLLISALNSILAAYTQTYVLVLGIYYKLQTFLYLPANGAIQGMRPLLSYNAGAKEYLRVRKIYKVTALTIVCVMAAGMVLSLCIPDSLLGMFTENPVTVQTGIPALRIICFGFVVSSLSVVSAGALEALGKGPKSLVISALRYVIFIIPAAFLLSRFLGPDAVWHAFWMTETGAAAIAFALYRGTVGKMEVK